MADILSFIRTGLRPFSWGACDCCTWACDLIKLSRGVDPAAPLRGRYRTRLGALRHARKAGGLPSLVRSCFADVGLAEASQGAIPHDGDVGMIAVPGGVALAVRMSGKWVAKSPTGIAAADVPHMAFWRI